MSWCFYGCFRSPSLYYCFCFLQVRRSRRTSATQRNACDAQTAAGCYVWRNHARTLMMQPACVTTAISCHKWQGSASYVQRVRWAAVCWDAVAPRRTPYVRHALTTHSQTRRANWTSACHVPSARIVRNSSTAPLSVTPCAKVWKCCCSVWGRSSYHYQYLPLSCSNFCEQFSLSNIYITTSTII